MSRPQVAWRPGGCHCGAVRFEVALADQVETVACNCSICAVTGFLHLIVDDDDFRLTQGEAMLSRYTFNTGVAQHLFCRACGVKSFYRPRSHPEGWSVNARCLDADTGVTVVQGATFDGRHWEAHVASLAPLSRKAQ